MTLKTNVVMSIDLRTINSEVASGSVYFLPVNPCPPVNMKTILSFCKHQDLQDPLN